MPFTSLASKLKGNDSTDPSTTETDKPTGKQLSIPFLNRLENLDKRLSHPFFLAQLPFVVEYGLSVPGNFFGIPIFALVVAPSLTAWFFLERPSAIDHNTKLWMGSVIIAQLVLLILWILLLSGSKKAAKIVYGNMFGAIAPFMGVGLLFLQVINEPPYDSDSSFPQQVGFFQLAAWCISIIPVYLLKPSIARMRPVAWCNSKNCNDLELKTALSQKHLQILPKIFIRDANASFPSGDTAGAVAVVYSLGRCGGNLGIVLALSCVAASAVGRMYWQAHHFGDVLTGIFIALSCCWLLENFLLLWQEQNFDFETAEYHKPCNCRAQWWQALAAHGMLATVVLLSRITRKTLVLGSGFMSQNDEEKKKMK